MRIIGSEVVSSAIEYRLARHCTTPKKKGEAMDFLIIWLQNGFTVDVTLGFTKGRDQLDSSSL